MIIRCNLSSQSLRNAADILQKYADSLSKRAETLVRNLGELGLDSAINGLGHIDTGDTLNSIQFNQNGNSGTVTAGGAAVWIEFGTGVLANASSKDHPKRSDVGAVNWGEYGHGLGKGRWWFINKDGEKRWTDGITMNPFMYNASQDMRREIERMAKEAFRFD